jgi:hypothetical protein
MGLSMNARSRKARAGGIALLAAAGCVVGEAPSYAHNRLVHQDMVDFAYQVGRLVARDAKAKSLPAYLAPPPGVAAADWRRYVDDIAASAARLDVLPTGLPPPKAEACRPDEGASDLPLSWPSGTLIGSVPQAVGVDYISGSGCGLRGRWHPGGVFNALQTPVNADAGGLVLGLWASNVDEQDDDTHLWIRPTSILGAGAVKAAASKAAKTVLAVLAIPFICAWDCIFHSCSDCMKGAKDFADAANPVDKIDGWLPGFGDLHGGDYNTMWHFMNVQPGRSDDYDDMQGLLYEEAGWHGEPDALDLAVMAFFDFLPGWSLNYEESQGIHHYQIGNGHDGHQNTTSRGESEWQFTTAAHTPFEPVDNVALYGWQHFRDDADHATHWLGFPLHALGDASAPHHLIGSTGWGHRPYEDSIERQWWAIRYIDSPGGDGANASGAQLAQIQRIVAAGYAWRKLVIDWRAADPARAHDVPIRDLVAQLGLATMADAETDGGWAFQRAASGTYLASQDAAISLYTGAGYVDHMRPTIERGVAAMLAFLISAAEVPRGK